MKKVLLTGVIASTLFCFAGMASAVPVTFLGEDLGGGESVRLTSWANSSAAQANFYANLTGVSTEDLESMSTNIADFGGGLTATLSGGERTYQGAGTNGVGRYPISGDYFWEATDTFTLTFSEGISAFGFYGVDIGDFNGQVVLTMTNGGTTALNIGNSTNVPGGGVLYFGFYDTENAYTSISFGNTAAGVDYFAFDNFTIGTLENVTPVPEPATLLLLGSGMVGLGALRVRRRISRK